MCITWVPKSWIVMADFSPRANGSIQQIFGEDFINLFLLDENGSSALNVDGSVTPVIFKAKIPSNIKDPWIFPQMTFLIIDANINISTSFGGQPALTNGLKLDIIVGDKSRPIFVRPVKINAEFGFYSNAGTLNVDRQDDAMTVIINSRVIGYELLGRPGSELVLTVQDDLSGMSRFECVALGYIRKG